MDIPQRIPKLTPSNQILGYTRNAYRPAVSVSGNNPANDYRTETVLRTLRSAIQVALFLAWDIGQVGAANRLVPILRDLDRQLEDLDAEARS